MNKIDFRTKYKNVRNSINLSLAVQKSKLIQNKLINLDIVQKSKVFFVYHAFGREVSTSEFINYLLNNKKTVLIPKCDTNTETMIPVFYSGNSKLIDNIYGIKETVSTDEYKGNIEVVIVPGIAFDRFGNRIGHGKGYYDKFLKTGYSCKIALCYSENLSDVELPHDENDVIMDYIITDREVVKIKS